MTNQELFEKRQKLYGVKLGLQTIVPAGFYIYKDLMIEALEKYIAEIDSQLEANADDSLADEIKQEK